MGNHEWLIAGNTVGSRPVLLLDTPLLVFSNLNQMLPAAATTIVTAPVSESQQRDDGSGHRDSPKWRIKVKTDDNRPDLVSGNPDRTFRNPTSMTLETKSTVTDIPAMICSQCDVELDVTVDIVKSLNLVRPHVRHDPNVSR